MLHHTGEKPFLRTRICKSCYKQFMSKLVLKSHKLGHTGEKPILELEIVTFVTTAHAKMCLEEPYAWSHWRETVPKLNDPQVREQGISSPHDMESLQHIITFVTNKTQNMVSGGLCPQYGKHVRLQYCSPLKTFLYRAHFVNIFHVTNVENLQKWTNTFCATCQQMLSVYFPDASHTLTNQAAKKTFLLCNYCGKTFG